MTKAVVIVGTTTWGTTLGITLARKGVPVTILARTPEEADGLNRRRENRRLLPGIRFPDSLAVDGDVEKTVGGADLVALAVPSEQFRRNIRWIGEHLSPEATVVSASKGLEAPDGKRMSQVMEEVLPPEMHEGICVLSGPNLAKEIAEEKPSATVVAGQESAKGGAGPGHIYFVHLPGVHQRRRYRRGTGRHPEEHHRPGRGHRRRHGHGGRTASPP